MKKILFIFLSITSLLTAAEKDLFREKEIRFIRELYSSGRYFDCIAETGKMQSGEINPMIEYFKYSNYYLAGQYTTVINNYKSSESSDDVHFFSLLLLSGSFLKKGMYYDSYKILKSCEYGELNEKYIFTMFLRRIEPLVLSGEADMIEKELTGSEIYLKSDNNFIKLRGELQQYNMDGLKSPRNSAIMSAIVPGLGQFYSRMPVEGIISFLSVAATAAGGVYLKEKGRKSLSYPLFFFSGLFYCGNIYGAYNSAASQNSEVIKKRHRNIITHFGSYNPGNYIEFERVFN